jgi:hypothetical protein
MGNCSSAQGEAQTYERSSLEDFIENRYGPSTRITNEHKHRKALAKAQEIKAKQDAETATLGRTFIRDANTKQMPSPSSPATRPR